MTDDYETTGIPRDRPGVRIARLLEAVTVLRGLWGAEPLTFDGEHYRISGLDGRPKPVRGSIPVLIGGGARRILTEAGRHADIVSLGLDNRDGVQAEHAGASATAAATREKLGWIRAGAADRAEPPQVSVRVLLVEVTEDRWSAATRLGRPLGLDAAAVLESPHALVGTPAQIVDDLRRRHDDFGFIDYVVSQSTIDDLAPVVEALA
jgi:alkanesulfonate monooxygenase SsuD/methylene tetrahydromethanopterin reductase-like flavin-dependent oxidoreductase (luciferase family)